jgi:mannose-6-phosphate isomerase-like protein (cupin superfamily)
MALKPVKKSPNEGESYPQHAITGAHTHTNVVLIPRADTEQCEVFTTVIAPEQTPAYHCHADTEQVYVCIRGAGQVHVQTDDGVVSFLMHPGDVCYVPRLAPHQSLPLGHEGFEYVVVDSFPGEKPPSHWTK